METTIRSYVREYFLGIDDECDDETRLPVAMSSLEDQVSPP